MGTAFKVKDSGNRRQFDTGSQRDTVEGKTRVDLVTSPYVMERLGHHSGKGAVKYDEWNWAKGQPNSVYIASAMRHLSSFSGGMIDEDHLAAAIWNLMGIMHNQESVNRNVFLCLPDEEPIAPNKDLLDFPVFSERFAPIKEPVKELPEAPCNHVYHHVSTSQDGIHYYKCDQCDEIFDENTIDSENKKRKEAPCEHSFEFLVTGLGGQRLYQCSGCTDVSTEADILKGGYNIATREETK